MRTSPRQNLVLLLPRFRLPKRLRVEWPDDYLGLVIAEPKITYCLWEEVILLRELVTADVIWRVGEYRCPFEQLPPALQGPSHWQSLRFGSFIEQIPQELHATLLRLI